MKVKKGGGVRVCYFGTYSMEEGYPRNRVIIEGLRRNGVEVAECHENLWKDTTEKLEGITGINGILRILYRLLHTYSRLINKFRHIGYYDAIIIGYAGHIDIFLAKVLNLFRRKPIIFDAFLSLYDTAVMDRQIVRAGSIKAKLLKMVDTWSCRIADAVLLDTNAHVDYFVREFALPSEKFHAIPVGSTLGNNVPPLQGEGKGGDGLLPAAKFNVLYFGSYIPLHGVDIIITAAKILQNEKDIVFTLIGKGQLLPSMKQLASDLGVKNVNFIDRFVEEKELVNYIRRADICLGIFGQTEKAMRVIPCKVYNCLAAGKTVITARTQATEGVLNHGENAYLCIPGDPEDLAASIVRLRDDATFCNRIACQGAEYYKYNFSTEAIGNRVREIISVVCMEKEKVQCG